MDNLARLKLRTNEPDEAILEDCLESAKAAIMAKADGSVVGTFHHVTDTPSSVLSRTSKKVITFRFT